MHTVVESYIFIHMVDIVVVNNFILFQHYHKEHPNINSNDVLRSIPCWSSERSLHNSLPGWKSMEHHQFRNQHCQSQAVMILNLCTCQSLLAAQIKRSIALFVTPNLGKSMFALNVVHCKARLFLHCVPAITASRFDIAKNFKIKTCNVYQNNIFFKLFKFFLTFFIFQ